jgi:hypothetical protein
MSPCGCKKKVPMTVQPPNRIIVVENGEVKNPPPPPPSPAQDVNNIVNKLNDILTPQ